MRILSRPGALERAAVIAFGLAFPGLAMAGQVPAPPASHFISDFVQASPAGATQEYVVFQNGSVVGINVSLLQLIVAAYNLSPNAVVGGPPWLADKLYYFRATVPAGTTTAGMMQMLQASLAQRFGLRTHAAQQPEPAFALKVASNPPKLTVAAADAAGTCVIMRPPTGGAERLPRTFRCSGVSMAAFAGQLPRLASGYVNKPVVDQTGLSGQYDFSLTFMPWTELRQPLDPGFDSGADVSLFAALQRLGLELEPVQAPAPVLVVDAARETPLVDAAHPMATHSPIPAAFEVAAIKPIESIRPGDRVYRVTAGGEADICCFSLEGLITDAYNLDAARLVGAPKWLDADYWDIRAKTVPGATTVDIDPMLQNLLQTRFHLAMHAARRVMPVFALRAGDHPKLTRDTAGGRSDCDAARSHGNVTVTLSCTNMTMAEFADTLHDAAPPDYVDRPVVDLTGLAGAYDFTVSFAAPGWMEMASSGRLSPDLLPNVASYLVSVPDALDKQLGLKLSSEKLPIAVEVIDHVERTPSGN